jgi:hypothetical protein
MDDDTLYQVPKFRYLGSIFREGGKNKEMFNNKKQLLVRIIVVWK